MTQRAGCVAIVLGILASSEAEARPGTHAFSVSTFDTRASSIALTVRIGFLDGGHFDTAGYNANFSSTSGNLSAQFGLHYLNLRDAADAPVSHGLSAGAVAVLSIPTSDRYDNGIPHVAMIYYVGSVPSVLISSESYFVSFPLVLGLGPAVSPSKAVTFTPWIELSPGANLDTTIHDVTLEGQNPNDFVDAQGNVRITRNQVESVLAQGVDMEFSLSVGARAGVDLALHASDAVDVKFDAGIGSLGTAFRGTAVFSVGGALVVRWDEIVPAVLPADKRLLREDCDSVEERYRACRAAEQTSEETAPNTPHAPQTTPASYPAESTTPTWAPSPQPPQQQPSPQPTPPSQSAQPVPPWQQAPSQQPAQQPPQTQTPGQPPTMVFPPVPGGGG